MAEPVRLLILGAHPDDAEYHAGGLASLHCRRGSTVRIVSVTDGSAGHHELSGAELAAVRREEAAAAGAVIGAEYHVWEFPDGRLQATLELRERMIREIRTFEPDLVLTHRTCDYHPDHRAVGQAVQDASYMVTVPPIAPDVPALERDPVVAYLPDLFTRPAPLAADVVLDVTDQVDTIVSMLACHRSQVFQWLPFNQGILDQVPDDETARIAWLRNWLKVQIGDRAERYRDPLAAELGPRRAAAVEFCEVYEISQYAAPLTAELRPRLFPREG